MTSSLDDAVICPLGGRLWAHVAFVGHQFPIVNHIPNSENKFSGGKGTLDILLIVFPDLLSLGDKCRTTEC